MYDLPAWSGKETWTLVLSIHNMWNNKFIPVEEVVVPRIPQCHEQHFSTTLFLKQFKKLVWASSGVNVIIAISGFFDQPSAKN
jgi:hypothetical protein